jgi:hypothetical protein
MAIIASLVAGVAGEALPFLASHPNCFVDSLSQYILSSRLDALKEAIYPMVDNIAGSYDAGATGFVIIIMLLGPSCLVKTT